MLAVSFGLRLIAAVPTAITNFFGTLFSAWLQLAVKEKHQGYWGRSKAYWIFAKLPVKPKLLWLDHFYQVLLPKQCVPTPIKVLPGSNPGRRRELVQNHVAMSRYTNWPPKFSTFMVIDHCTLNIQPCMIHFCVRTNILVK